MKSRLWTGVLVLGLVSTAQAAPGNLDTSFSSDGQVTTALAGEAGATAVAIQPDGRIVVGGIANANVGNGDLAIVRYLANGTLDTSFSGDGVVTLDFANAVSAIAVQPDGRIVAAGPFGSAVALARFNADGTSDNTLSGDGRHQEFLGFDVNDMALQADGRIVVVGSTSAANVDLALARFTAAGVLDTTFGPSDTGVVTENLGADDHASAVAIQPDGKIVIAGSMRLEVGQSGPSSDQGDFVIERFTSDGQREFISLLPFIPTRIFPVTRGEDLARDIVLQPDGKIVAVGDSIVDLGPGSGAPLSQTVQVARYDANGRLDSTFGVRHFKYAADTEASGSASAVAIQLDGKIVVAGTSQSGGPGTFGVLRLHSNGTLDTTFDGDGRLATTFAGTVLSGGRAMAIQPGDGRIVVAGTVHTSNDRHFALTRYHAIGCNNQDVTILGSNGPDALQGRTVLLPGSTKPVEFNDVIHGMGGADTINGGGGNDALCGGSGNDILTGGAGNDALLGESGGDNHDGGNGADTCVGGPLQIGAVDNFLGCETVSTVSSGLSGAWRDVFAACNHSGHRPRCQLSGAIDVTNPGVESTAIPARIAFYLSTDTQLDENDRFLATEQVRALLPGDVATVSFLGQLRGVSDTSGMFVIALLDDTNVIAEANEANNVVVSLPVH